MDDKIKYIEGLVPKNLADLYEAMLYTTHPGGTGFMWQYAPNSANNPSDHDDFVMKLYGDNIIDNGQFVHSLFQYLGEEKDPYYDEEVFEKFNTLIWFMLDKLPDIEIKQLIRMKANFIFNPNPKLDKRYTLTPHCDVDDDDVYSLLYYVNDCDGDTIIFDQTKKDVDENPDLEGFTEQARFSPKKGDAILFPSKYFHVAELPVIKEHRFVVNTIMAVFSEKEKKLLNDVENGKITEEEILRELQL